MTKQEYNLMFYLLKAIQSVPSKKAELVDMAHSALDKHSDDYGLIRLHLQ